ncbi:hypothetical protein C9374_014235 [Naegleria lovaniensis]|uniref:Uncharacterized protein n=1 Tax=Naegleria lovaniensis TaxID=51637 RepID=A0AA88GEC2_NAELO|nr:uncharacterized protein C9374_014235 [Naegleria lovaniensis]KAG2370777.1 hypothetical protein C9374_014235 [Naegleria lovaniensis]
MATLDQETSSLTGNVSLNEERSSLHSSNNVSGDERPIISTMSNVGEGPEYFLMSLIQDEELAYMYGGENNNGLLSNVFHVLDPHLQQFKQVSWKTLPRMHDLPPKVEGHSLSLIKVGDKKELFLFGGLDNMRTNGYGNTLYALDVNDMKWEIVQASNIHEIRGRRQHAAASVGSKIYIFGGEMMTDNNDTKLLDDLIVFDRESCTWNVVELDFQESNLKPPPLRGHTMVFDGNSNLYVFGGKTEGSLYSGQLWQFNVDKRQWGLIKPNDEGIKPKGREMHSAVLHENVIYFYGGWSQGGPTNDLLSFNLEDGVWKQWKHSLSHTKDSVRFGHCSCLVNSNQLLILGGRNHLFQNQQGVLTISLQKSSMEEIAEKSTQVFKLNIPQVIELEPDEKVLMEQSMLSKLDALDVTKYKLMFHELTEQQIKVYDELAIVLATQAETVKEVKQLLEQQSKICSAEQHTHTSSTLETLQLTAHDTCSKSPVADAHVSVTASPSKTNKKNKKKKKK